MTARSTTHHPEETVIAGWREWVALPELGVAAIKAKLDTGARTSAIHAHQVRRFRKRGALWVRFLLYTIQRAPSPEILCEAPVTDERFVTDSGGHREKRLVITTLLAAGGREWPIEVTITRRDNMRFRMLLGRTALIGRIAVDPEKSYRFGRPELAASTRTEETP